MGFDKVKLKQIRRLLLFVAGLILLLMYSSIVFTAAGAFFRIMKPFIYGAVIAFVLNIPLCGIESKLLGKWRGKTADRLKRPVCIIMSILFVLLLVTVVAATVVPQVAETAMELGSKIPVFIQKVLDDLKQMSTGYPQLQGYVAQLQTMELDWQSYANGLLTFLKTGMTSMLSSTMNVAGSIIGGVIDVVIAFIFSVYILGQKEKLAGQGKLILSAYLPEKANKYMLKVCSLGYRNFSNFISGQCLEAVILGCLFVIVMTVSGMPYAVLVGVLIAFTALIPIVGAFIGCAVGAFLIMVDNPVKALWFIIIFLILQQIEGNLIYPRVVGSSVGLPSMWVLMAVSVGGSLFGIPGMLFFIPLVSTIYMLLRDSVYEKIALKNRRYEKRRQPYKGQKYSEKRRNNEQNDKR